ncbi:MAG: serine--tRNA ligase [Pseudomonadota bacterium]
MHDIKAIRENPAAFDDALARRSLPAQSATLLALDAAKREEMTELQNLQAQRNDVAKRIPEAKKKGEDIAALLAEGNAIKEKIAALEAAQNEGGELEAALSRIPNLLAQEVPAGADEAGNIEERVVGSKPALSFAPQDHVALGEALGLMDFEGAAKLSGARFVVLKGALARMERALAAFMLDIHTNEFGFTEHQVPFMVKDAALYGTGQLPKFSEDLFRTTNDYWLIPTSEVSLTNLVADSIVEDTALPLRMTAFTPCFRSEAGSAGRDTRGMIRQHQFSKVEMVSITTPEQSGAEHERMLSAAEEVLKRLGLHYRVMLLCAGDTGFSARKTYDIEVWLPAQDTFREISSCSNCGDFQARRMKARFRKAGAKDTQFVHTLNGSGLAVGRTLVAILENYQQADGSITIPAVLVPYMGGLTVIKR